MKIAASSTIVSLAAGLAGMVWSGTAQAASVSFDVALSGAACTPPVETTGTGTALLTYDAATQMLTWNVTYSRSEERRVGKECRL